MWNQVGFQVRPSGIADAWRAGSDLLLWKCLTSEGDFQRRIATRNRENVMYEFRLRPVLLVVLSLTFFAGLVGPILAQEGTSEAVGAVASEPSQGEIPTVETAVPPPATESATVPPPPTVEPAIETPTGTNEAEGPSPEPTMPATVDKTEQPPSSNARASLSALEVAPVALDITSVSCDGFITYTYTTAQQASVVFQFSRMVEVGSGGSLIGGASVDLEPGSQQSGSVQGRLGVPISEAPEARVTAYYQGTEGSNQELDSLLFPDDCLDDPSPQPMVGDLVFDSYDCETGVLSFRVAVENVPHVPDDTSGFDYPLHYTYTADDFSPPRTNVWNPPADQDPFTGMVTLSMEVLVIDPQGNPSFPGAGDSIDALVYVGTFGAPSDSTTAPYAVECDDAETPPTPTDVPATVVPTQVPPTAEPTVPPTAGGTVEVAVGPERLPAGSQVCLINVDTGTELCEPVPEAGAGARPGVRAFMQTSGVTITFEDVPPGTWRLVLRVPGFQDLVITETVSVTADQVTDAGEIPADVADQLEPVVPPGPISIDLLIRLLISILIQILTSLGGR